MTPSAEKPKEGSKPKLERSFIIERQGKPFVLMAGLLDLAHQDGLDLIETHLVQIASDENALTNVFRAIVHTRTGTFTGHGSAGPANVSRMMLTHTLELAETRAIGRALRFATNIGMTTIEELGDDPIPSETEAQPAPPRVQQQPPVAPPRAPMPELPRNIPPAEPLRGDITPAQLRAIYSIARDKHNFSEARIEEECASLFGVRPSELTRKQASDFITNMQGRA